MKPELKQFGALTQSDFERFPVWASVHTLDYDEPWYEEADEETFRPWVGEFPIDPNQGIFLVRSQMILNDGTKFAGFITPITGTGKATDTDLSTLQPYLFSAQGTLVTFWGGMFGISEEVRKATYNLLERTSSQIFPIRFNTASDLTKGKQSGEIRGFYKMTDFKSRKVEVSF